MRRKEREVTKESDIEAIIKRSLVCRLGLSDGDKPYVVPLCFGYKDKALYFHGAYEGRKMDILKKNQMVCFEFDIDTEIIEAENPCHWGMKYLSAIVFGKAVFLEGFDEKKKAIDIIMSQYSDREFQFTDIAIERTAVIKVEIERMTGKQSE